MMMLKLFYTQYKAGRIKYLPIFSVFLLFYIFAIFSLSGTGNEKYEQLHLLLDTSIGILSLLLALFILSEQNEIQHNARLYLAIGLGFASATELLHAFVGIEWAGGFAWIRNYAGMLRPVTWPPSTYVLPLSLLWAIWLMRRNATLRPVLFVAGIALCTLAIYFLSFYFPPYFDTGLLGIQRPTQIGVLFLLLMLIVACWQERHKSPVFEGLAWMAVLLFLSDLFMLYATSPYEKFTMMAHVGKLLAYIFMHVIQMRMAMVESRARKQAETALLQEEQNLRKVINDLIFLEHAVDQHAIVGVTDVHGTITYANDSFCTVSGYMRAELIGQNHRMLKSGIHTTEFFRDMYRTIASGKVWKGEICNRAKDGHLYWVRTTIVPVMDEHGKPKQYISLRADISVRKQAEADLIRYQEHLEELVAEQLLDLKLAKETAEAANRSKSYFLANMSHEIRTPMNGVVGMVDILQETNLTPEQRRMVSTIRNSSLALLGILGDILDFSKIEAGKLEIDLTPVNLREVVEGVAQLLAPTVADKNLDLIVFVHPDIPSWIRTDSGRLRQILFNLLGNAVKFTHSDMSRKGQIMLRVEKNKPAEGQDVLQFRIVDNGVGMAETTMAQLFQPFVQADATTTRRFGGTGLGLSICKHLIELLHGKIGVASTLGSGTEFTVTLPLEVAQAAYAPVVLSELAGMKVLIVTDHPAYAEILPAYIRAAGAQVKMVANREAALHVIQQSAEGEWGAVLDLIREVSFDAVFIKAVKQVSPTLPVVQLVSRRSSASPANLLSVSANPLLFDELVHTLAIASRRHSIKQVIQKTERRSQPRKQLLSVEDAIANHELILVAEDNEVSREVIQEQLNILGYASEWADDGLIALEKWRSGRYSLLLTDCHMPNMDGFGLTAAIRKEEAQGRHIRIIAVTGNAMHGEAQRCLASGMDDYLAKPIRLSDLGTKLTKWLPQARLEGMPEPEPETQPSAADTIPAGAEVVWDDTTLTRMVGDHPAMHRRLLDKFISGTEEQVAAIISAAATGDCDTVAGVAHKMKSAARTVGGLRLGELCQQLEMSAKTGDVQAVDAQTSALEGAFLEVVTQIKNSYSA